MIKKSLTSLFVLALTLTAFTTNALAVGPATADGGLKKPMTYTGQVHKGERILLRLESGNTAEIAIETPSSSGAGGKQASLSPTFGRNASITWVESNQLGWEVWRYTAIAYWSGNNGVIYSVSPADSFSRTGWGSFWIVNSRSTGWYWSYYNTNAVSTGHLEIFTQANYAIGQLSVQYCTLDLRLYLDGWGGAWGGYTGVGC